MRDRDRLERAFYKVDYIIHTAALKQVPASEYNPFEAVKTNILGAENIINAAIDQGVTKVIALSTDKACNPINLYGATKLCSDKLFIAGNSYAGGNGCRFSVVRYGNVIGSKGSVVPTFLQLARSGKFPITDRRMTRFWITMEQACSFILRCLEDMEGGEIFVPKIPSMRIVDMALAINPQAIIEEIGKRPGEKLHEVLISEDDADRTLELGDHYLLEPQFPWWGSRASRRGTRVDEHFSYTSDRNDQWLDAAAFQHILSTL